MTLARRLAPRGCSARAGEKIVRHLRAAEGSLREVHVAVDAARHH